MKIHLPATIKLQQQQLQIGFLQQYLVYLEFFTTQGTHWLADKK